MALTNIALIGANGNLGPSILSALLAIPTFTITILSRANSKSRYPPSVKVINLPDHASEANYTSALANIDAFITTFAGTNASLQITLANAAAAAGVQLFIPADFGSCDSSSPFALSLMPLYVGKKRVREHLQSLASTTPLTWTSIICGHFFDYGLASGLLLFEVKAHTATIVDGGDIRFSCSTLAQVGRAIVQILHAPATVRNTMVYVQSFSLTQNQLVHVLEKVTASRWHLDCVKSSDFIAENKAVLDTKGYDHDASENLVGVVGIVDGDWTNKSNFANRILGLEDEDLESVVRQVVRDST